MTYQHIQTLGNAKNWGISSFFGCSPKQCSLWTHPWAEFGSPMNARSHLCCFFSRNIGYLTLKIIYFHYLKKHFLVQRIQKNRLFTFEKGSTDVYTDLPDAAHTLLQLNVSSTWLAWNVQKQWIMLHSWKLVWSKELLEILRLQTRSSENREQCVCFWN